MCYVHLDDNCKTCNEYKSKFGKEPDHIQWTHYFMRNEEPRFKRKKIKLFGITVGTIEENY